MGHALCGAGSCSFLLIALLAGVPEIGAEELPASCGSVGASGYRTPEVVLPVVVLDRGTAIVVTSAGDLVNGSVTSVAALRANPGPDGIALREALTAANADPGTWNIQFAAALAGKTIDVNGEFPILRSGNITINGDTNGDRKPDITLQNFHRDNPTVASPFLFRIASGGNTIHAVSIHGFAYPYTLSPRLEQGLLTNTTFANNVISATRLTGVSKSAIVLNTSAADGNVVTDSRNRWLDTWILDNTIEAAQAGIDFLLFHVKGNTLERTVIANNTIRITEVGQNHTGSVGMTVGATGFWAGSRENKQLDTLIAYNTVEGIPLSAIRVSSGEVGAQDNIVDGVRIIGNRVRSRIPDERPFPPRSAIAIVNGDAGTDYIDRTFQPVTYADRNIMRNVFIQGNIIEEQGGAAIGVGGGCCGSEGSITSDILIEGNIVRSSWYAAGLLGMTGGGNGGYLTRRARGNQVLRAVVRGNTAEIAPRTPLQGAIATGGAIVLFGGIQEPANSIADVEIRNNLLSTSLGGIQAIAGFGTDALESDDNRISRLRVECNQIEGSDLSPWYPEIGGLNVVGGWGRAQGNRADEITLRHNLVNGVLDAFSVFANLGDAAGTNTVSFRELTGAGKAPYYTANGVVNAASFAGAPTPGGLATVFGLNLARNGSEGTTVLTADGRPLHIVAALPGQVSFQAPWSAADRAAGGAMEMRATVLGVTGPPVSVPLSEANPGLFSLGNPNGGQGAILDAGWRLVGPENPVRAGEYIQIFATGLGPVDFQPADGEGGGVSPLSRTVTEPVVTVGGRPARVAFSGLAPGLVGVYQVNAQIPDDALPGDTVPVHLIILGGSSNSVSIAVRR